MESPTTAVKRAFVTGATGFVGSNLVRALLADGTEVRALLRRGSDRTGLSGLEVEAVEGDLGDRALVEGALHGCDACFHLAAAYSLPDRALLHEINVEGTRTVLDAARAASVPRIVHASTIGTLGRSDGRGLIREGDSWLADDASDYVRSKFLGERIADDLARTGVPILIAHIAAPVGPHDRVPTVTGRRIIDVLRRKMPRYIRGAIHHVPVQDVARGLILAARRGRVGAHYILGLEGGNLDRAEFVRLVCRAAGIRPPRRGAWELCRGLIGNTRASPRSGEPATLACDPSWSVRELGLPQTPLDAAFASAVAWFRDRGMV